MQLTRTILCLPCLAVLITISACDDTQVAETLAAPLPSVHVATVKTVAVPVTHDLPGRVAPVRLAEIRPRVTGLVIHRAFVQGAEVKEGDLLYQIDPAPFRIELERTEAALARAAASVVLTRQQAERLRSLLKSKTASQAQYDIAYASLKQAEANAAFETANRDRARLSLGYTDVRAPIAGRIGAALVTEGAFVEKGTAQSLATIQQLDPIYVDITQSVSDLTRLRQQLASGDIVHVAPGSPNARLILEDGTLYPHPGRLLFAGVETDPSTGQVILRAEFPNPTGDLFPGMFVRARVQQGTDGDAIVVPEHMLQSRDGEKAEIYVLDEGDKVQLKSIEVGSLVEGNRIVVAGLEAGDRLVTDGFDKLSDGMQVKSRVMHATADVE